MKDPREIVDHLSPTDALSILRTLADSDEGLARRIAEMATAYLTDVDRNSVTGLLSFCVKSRGFILRTSLSAC